MTLKELAEKVKELEAENERLRWENGTRQKRIERLEKLHTDIIAHLAALGDKP